MPEKLKPCPSCRSAAGYDEDLETGPAFCPNSECPIGESHNDFGYEVSRWNSFPRTDASQGMSDGELSARVAIGAMRWDNPWPFKQIDDESTAWHLANQAEVRAELDRRAAARKESKP